MSAHYIRYITYYSILDMGNRKNNILTIKSKIMKKAIFILAIMLVSVISTGGASVDLKPTVEPYMEEMLTDHPNYNSLPEPDQMVLLRCYTIYHYK